MLLQHRGQSDPSNEPCGRHYSIQMLTLHSEGVSASGVHLWGEVFGLGGFMWDGEWGRGVGASSCVCGKFFRVFFKVQSLSLEFAMLFLSIATSF